MGERCDGAADCVDVAGGANVVFAGGGLGVDKGGGRCAVDGSGVVRDLGRTLVFELESEFVFDGFAMRFDGRFIYRACGAGSTPAGGSVCTDRGKRGAG